MCWRGERRRLRSSHSAGGREGGEQGDKGEGREGGEQGDKGEGREEKGAGVGGDKVERGRHR